MSQLFAQYPAAIRSIAQLVRHPKHQAFIVGVALLILVGVLFYASVEGWSIIDSFYFTVIALVTIGFGDLVPTSEGSRLFTSVYAVVVIGVIGTALHLVVTNAWSAAAKSRRDVTGGDVE